MHHLITFLALMVFSAASSAADAPAISPTIGLFKMVIGLAIVLLVLALITWAMKKFMGNVQGNQSVIKTVGGVSVGTRERVVVLEVAGRWLVVGVASGQVSSLANLEAGDVAVEAHLKPEATDAANKPAFSDRLKASASKLTEKNNG